MRKFSTESEDGITFSRRITISSVSSTSRSHNANISDHGSNDQGIDTNEHEFHRKISKLEQIENLYSDVEHLNYDKISSGDSVKKLMHTIHM